MQAGRVSVPLPLGFVLATAALAFRMRAIKPSLLRLTEPGLLLALGLGNCGCPSSAHSPRLSSGWRRVFLCLGGGVDGGGEGRLTLKMMYVNPSSVWYEATWTRATCGLDLDLPSCRSCPGR